MRLSLTKFQLYWLTIWCAVIVYLFLQDSVFARTITHTKDFSQNQFEISYIFPLGRTSLVEDGQTVREEPVYVTAYSPRRYRRASVFLSFDSMPEGWKIGVQTAPGFSYRFIPLSLERNQSIDITLSDAYIVDNSIRFIFSNDNATIEPITLHELTITLSEPVEGYGETLFENLNNAYGKVSSFF